MEVLSPIIGETAASIVILAAVLLLIAALALLVVGLALRIFSGRGFGFRGSRNRAPRLSVPDMMPVDSRRKLVLVRRDTVEHLLLVGGATDVLIETAIQRPVQAAPAPRTRPAGAPAAAAPAAAPAPMPAPPPPPPVREVAASGPTPMPAPPQTARPSPRPATAPRAANPRPVVVPAPEPAPPPAMPARAAAAPPTAYAMPPRPAAPQSYANVPVTGTVVSRMPPPGNRPPAAPLVAPSAPEPPPRPVVRAVPVEPEPPVFVAIAPPEPVETAGRPATIEEEMAALVPSAVADSLARPDEPGANAAAAPVADEEERQRAERVTSRENEMAALLGEIFGKK